MIMNGQRMLVRVVVKQPLTPEQRWFVAAPVKVPEIMPNYGRGVVFKPAENGHRAEWIITTFLVESAHELARDLIVKETTMRKDAAMTYDRMVREFSYSPGPGAAVS